MSALVEMTQFGARTSSRIVAEAFEKEHKDVLRAIDAILEKRPNLNQRNFAPIEAMVKIGFGERAFRAYEMDRDGFALVAFGFTGEKALDWKLAFIEAFNAMEAALMKPQPAPVEQVIADDHSPLMLEERQTLVRLAVVKESMRVHGRKYAQAVWRQMGLPSGIETGRRFDVAGPSATGFSDWADNCTVAASEQWTGTAQLYQSYCAFCANANIEPDNLTRFGTALAERGHHARKNSDGRVERQGIALVN